MAAAAVRTGRQGGGPAIRTTRGKVRRIPLGGGLFATVDARDYKWLSQYKWCVLSKCGAPYAVRRTKDGRMVYMHREIMGAPKGSVVDHIDHNTLNNRRCNLRVCTQAQNHANAGPRGLGIWVCGCQAGRQEVGGGDQLAGEALLSRAL